MLRTLKQLRAIISGSTALAILMRGAFRPNDLDIYVPRASEAKCINIMHRDYLFDTTKTLRPPYGSISGVYRIHWMKKEEHSINVIVVTGDNAAATIFQFHSTVVMNYLTGHGLLCAYPHLTLNKLSIANPGSNRSDRSMKKVEICYNKYRQRGFTHVERLNQHSSWETHMCGFDKSCPATPRSLYDGGCLFIPFLDRDNDGNMIEPPYYDGLHTVVWSLGGTPCKDTIVALHHHAAFSIPLKVIEVRQ
ncbi:hypothetical protein R3P38DRAFT_2561855 [Favolaschia claudopus]|uniref:Uncharacterized protein n=1 Tax=Favolaschia claudopus TaxID=2862362 RepID=A0AAW0A2W1_9AGAR